MSAMPPEDSQANGRTRALSEALRCVGCGRTPTPDENPLDDWRAYSTGIELLLFCPECSDREFSGHSILVPIREHMGGRP